MFLLIFFINFSANAQVDEEEQDSLKTGYNVGSLKLQDPPSILDGYTYDPASDRYIYTKNIDGFNISYPLILTPKQYEELALRESMRSYFKKKSDAIDGKKEGTEEAQKDLLPRYYVNSGFFTSIFGSNTIDLKPTGSVEVDLGIRYTKQENPSFSPNNQSTTNFDFDQRISMSLMGKVGTRLGVTINYDTESTFAFQNLIKLEYTPEEDDIIKKIEIGNVSFPLNSSLIRGAQNLFGVKAQAQFGKTTITGIYSDQKSQTKVVNAQSGGTIQDFEIFGLDYDADRHFFLSQYFRNNYDESLKNYPFINNRVQITRVEVWVTNKVNRVSGVNNNLRNIVAIQDLGEAQLNNLPTDDVVVIDPVPPGFFTNPSESPVSNTNNLYSPSLIANNGGLLNSNVREIATVAQGFNTAASAVEGVDYVKLENARKLMDNEFTLNPQLGYISLQQRLANDEILAIAYEYTIGSEVYQVGEFGNNGVDGTQAGAVDPSTGQPSTVVAQTLILKMLKSNLTDVEQPIWNIMMKNIYQIPGGYQVEREDFRFNINYISATALNFITPVEGTPFPPNPAPGEGVSNTPLLNVFNLDKLNYNNDPQTGGDGFFDFIEGMTFDSQNGRIIFTTVEPFGKTLFDKLSLSPTEDYNGNPDSPDYNANQKKYVYKNLYRKTQTTAFQDADKNKFQLKGKYKQSGGDGIPIGAFNVPQGSVVVTAGGRVLIEGVDYSVNYQAGRVQILDPSLQASNVPIEVSVENNSVFGQQTRRFMGLDVQHQIAENFLVGGSVINFMEKPLTQKASYGQESVNNTIFGFNANYSTEVPFFTRMVNKLPNIDTDVPSNLSVNAELAYLMPGSPKVEGFDGQSTVYIDDFEGSETSIDLRSPSAWTIASTPSRNSFSPYPDFGGDNIDMSYGFKRAKLTWYTIDPIFYNQRPSGISVDDMSLTTTRRIYSQELYPETQIPAGQLNVINTLDLTYYPTVRGAYNNNPAAASGVLPNPKDNFGGIVRALGTTNFEQSNVEYIQMWVLDPYVGNGALPQDSNNSGKIYFNLGSISEDVLKDGRKQFENGLPEPNSTELTYKTIWGIVPAAQSLVYAFDANDANRTAQDIGLDGMNDAQEAAIYNNFAGLPDPAADNYQYFLQAQGGILERYYNYNGTQGNSPTGVTESNRGNSTLPDAEDINRDSTMDGINAYFEYSIDIQPGMNTGTTKYVSNILNTVGATPGSTYGNTTEARWIQFKIPISQFENKIGPISDFRSIRFMRMFMTGFESDITVRFGSLEFVRGDWLRYKLSLDPLESNDQDALDTTAFDQEALNVYEDSNRTPIPYVMPPGVYREQVYVNNTVIDENEQSLSLTVAGTGLEAGDSRAVFKNVSIDMRQYKNINMFMHAESLPAGKGEELKDSEMAGFVRFGNDLSENFYQIELPLEVTQPGAITSDEIWPSVNNIQVSMDLLTQAKLKLISSGTILGPGEIYYITAKELDPTSTSKLRIGVRGNPNFGLIRNLLLGVKNNTTYREVDGADLIPKDIYGSLWFDELRMSDMDNKGGMAGVVNVDTNLADFATLSVTGRMSTIGFGTLEQGPQERSREDIQQYNIITNVNVGQLLPKKWGINVPFNYGIGEETATPEYDPYNQDIKLDQVLDYADSQEEKDFIRNRAIDYTKRQSINFIGIKKDRQADQKPKIYDPENLTLSYSYNQVEKHNYEIEEYNDEQVVTNVNYTYAFEPKSVEPLKKNAFMSKSKYWDLLRDFNFNYLPTNINFNTSINRQYNKQQFRQVDIVGIAPSALYKRNYLFNYQYGFNYNLTKSLRINYNVSSSNIITNYLDENNDPINDVNLWSNYFDPGEANSHSQQITLNYDIPIYKIPVLGFVKATYSYIGDYSWLKTSRALSDINIEGVNYDLGNTIQNANAQKLNTTLNMDSFYKYIGLTKNKAKVVAKPVAPPKPGEKITQPAQAQSETRNAFVEGMIGVLTSVKNIQINYAESNGTVLPGYTPGIGFFGTTKPTLGFIVGLQDDVRYDAARKGLLTTYPDFNMNYTTVHSENLNYTANIDLFPDFKIDVYADRLEMNNYSEQYDVTNGVYNPRSPYSFGNYSISTILIGTSFAKSNEFFSEPFNDLMNNRLTVANRLAETFYAGQAIPRYGDPANPIPDATTDPTNNAIYVANLGYPIGFGKNNQAVLLPSFLAAYSGQDASSSSLGAFKSFPLPNWTIKYTGLMNIPFFKEKFRRFSLISGYKATYTLNSFRSNFNYVPSGFNAEGDLNTDAGGNIYNSLLISNVNLIEQFSPLVKFDFELKNSVKIVAAMNKDRALSMSFDNNLVTEVSGLEYIVGFGYRIKDVVINSKLAGNATGIIKSDININCNFSFRDNQNIVRNLDYNNNQLSGGQNIWSLKLTADYNFTRNLTAIFYYDQSYSKAVISTSFPVSNILTGFTLRYNFGN